MGKPYSCTQFIKKSRIFYYKLLQNLYHDIDIRYHKSRAVSEYAIKSEVHMMKLLLPSYQAIKRKKTHLFVAVGIVTLAVHS